MSAIDDYLKDVRPGQRKALERVRKIAKSVVPDAEETISYGIPTLKYKGKYLIYFAAFKNHMSIFPGGSLVESMREKLKDYKLAKGTIQFTEEMPLSEDIIRELAGTRFDTIRKA